MVPESEPDASIDLILRFEWGKLLELVQQFLVLLLELPRVLGELFIEIGRRRISDRLDANLKEVASPGDQLLQATITK